MEIRPAGSQPSSRGATDSFSGAVRRDPIFTAREPSRLSAASVTFEPGARTHWHTHPFGQLLVITAGSGRVCTWGGKVRQVRAGDAVWFEPGEKHWHGAGATTALTHIAITEMEGEEAVTWLEPVTDEQFELAE